MSELTEQILKLVDAHVKEKIKKEEKWIPGQDWVSYSGPVFDSEEYLSAVESLLDGWLIFGKKGREFELKFSEEMGKNLGVLTNSGSSANLLMWAALTSQDSYVKNVLNIKNTEAATKRARRGGGSIPPELVASLKRLQGSIDVLNQNISVDRQKEPTAEQQVIIQMDGKKLADTVISRINKRSKLTISRAG